MTLLPKSLESASGLPCGLNKGFITTKRHLRLRHSCKRGNGSTTRDLVKETVRETVGFAPYERRMQELLKIGTAATHKRCLKFAKKRLGTHKRGKAKRAEMEAVIAAAKRK